MNRTLALGALAASILLTVDAVKAADIIVPRRERAPVERQAQPARQTTASNWDGGQIGGNGGGSVSNNNFVEPGAYVCSRGSVLNTNCFETPFSFVERTWSFVGGGFAGYRVQMGNTVVGVEGDVLWKNARASEDQFTNCSVVAACGTGGLSRMDYFTGVVRQGWEASIRGRYGVLVTQLTLLYFTVGVSFGEMSGSFRYSAVQAFGNIANTAFADGSWRDVRVGGTVGVGAESEVASGVKLRGEYRFTHYGKFSKDIPLTTTCAVGCGTPISTNAHIDVRDIYNHKFLVGIGFDVGKI